MDVELVSIGDELLLGFTVDTNTTHFARVASTMGVQVVRRTTVGDDAGEIRAVVREGLDRTGAVITCGGLGPTADDLTKPSIAALFGREMTFDAAIWESLRRRWKARGLPGELPESNRAQAMIPAGATILPNAHGSAPGIWLEDERGRWVAMLPGVPREFRGMTTDTLLPRLVERGAGGQVIRSLTLRTQGVAESSLADALGELAKLPLGVPLAFMPGWEGVDLRLTVRGMSSTDADAALGAAAAALRERIGKWVYGENEAQLAAIVLELLRGQGLRAAVGESCTGGMLGMLLTAVPGSSDVFWGGVIAYDNAVKLGALGVSQATLDAHGAVSEEVAREMARGVRERLGVEVGVSITGIAGPSGGTPEKPVGTFCIAADVRGTLRSVRSSGVGDRHEVRQRASQAALSLLRRTLSGA